jgi:hypothetical protein
MTRRFPPPWRAEKFSGGYVVRDATGFAVAYVYGRSTEDEAMEAKQITMDEARRVASNIGFLARQIPRPENNQPAGRIIRDGLGLLALTDGLENHFRRRQPIFDRFDALK